MVDKHNHEQPHVYDAPSDVDAKDGIVSVKGPDAVDVNLTPDAAVETSDGRPFSCASRHCIT